MHIIFETPRLYLRRFTEADTSILVGLNSDPEVLQYLHEPLLQNEAQAREVLENILLPQYEMNLGRWAIHLKENDQFIGWCGLKFRSEPEEIDLGYRLAKLAWGKGYATEAAQHTLQYGFDSLQLEKIMARAHIENLASIKVLEKIGMTYIGNGFVDGSPVKTYCAHRLPGPKPEN